MDVYSCWMRSVYKAIKRLSVLMIKVNECDLTFLHLTQNLMLVAIP